MTKQCFLQRHWCLVLFRENFVLLVGVAFCKASRLAFQCSDLGGTRCYGLVVMAIHHGAATSFNLRSLTKT
jgi:hypothetical protein